MTTAATTTAGLIYQAIPKIMAEIIPIGKDRKNEHQHYNFRGIDDVYNFVQPILAKHSVFFRSEILDVVRSERPSRNEGFLTFVQIRARYHLVASDGSSVATDAVGEGMDAGDKAVPKALSIAQKYAILQMFCIPTADPKDPEIDDPDPAPKPAPKSAPVPTKAELLSRVDQGMTALKDLKKTPEQIYKGIVDEVYAKCKRRFAELSELSEAELAVVLDYLTRWYKHVKAGKQTAAAKHADDDTPPDGVYA